MRASALEYRFRYLLHVVIYVLGFTAPWNYWLHLDPPGPNTHVWGLLAFNLMGAGVRNIGAAFDLVLVVAIACAVLGALLRTWGAAYLGSGVVQSSQMHAARGEHSSEIIEAGPYRYVRNPLYLGTILHSCALALLMPRSGAIFVLVVIPVVQIRLILAEEPFLLTKLGAPYAAYCGMVPRLLPALMARIAGRNRAAAWPQAVLGEIYMWGVAVSFAVAGWRYSATLLVQCVVISMGLSLVLRALVPGSQAGGKV